MKSKISVIIPMYNEEKYIERCLLSLHKQTLKPEEIIIVDDGSSDNSKIKIRNAKPQFNIKNLITLSQKHAGPGKARNLGAKHANGDILVFVDADMYFDKDYLKYLVEPIQKGETVATFTKEEYVANPKNVWSICWSINSYLPVRKRIPFDTPDTSDNFRAIKRSTFIKTKGYKDIGYGEDASVLKQIPGLKSKAAPGAVCYHFNPDNLSEVFFSALWFGRGETMKGSLKGLTVHSFPNSIRRGVIEAIRHKIPQFLIFKIVFDFGVVVGAAQRFFGLSHVK